MTNRENGGSFAPPENQGLNGHSNHRTADSRVIEGTTRVTSFSAGSERAMAEHAARAAQAPPSNLRVNYGPLRYSNGVVTEPTENSQRHAVPTEGQSGGSILSTLNSSSGRPSVELQPGVPGSRTLVEVAVRLGYLAHNAQGALVMAGTVPQTAARQHKDLSDELALLNQLEVPDETDPTHGGVNAEEEGLWQLDIAPLTQHGHDHAVASVVSNIVHGHGTVESIANTLASTEGMAPAQAREFVDQGIAFHTRIVERAIATAGITDEADVQAFFASTRANPLQLQDAIQKLAHARDLTGFMSMARVYTAGRTAPAAKAAPPAPAAPAVPAAPPAPAARSPGSPGWSKNGPGKELTREQKIARALADPYGDSF